MKKKERRYKACTHCTLTCHANISEAQKDDRKKAKERRRKREKKPFHTRMQSKIKIPNKLHNNKKTQNQTEMSPKSLTTNTWRVKGDRRRGWEKRK